MFNVAFDTNFIIAQVFGFLGILFNISSMQMKKRRNIIIMLLALNLAAALNFVFLGELSGSYISFFAVVETFINYLFERKKKPIPTCIIAIYIIVNIVLGLVSFRSPLDILSIAAAVIFCFAISAQKESTIRKLMLSNQIIWAVYDVFTGAYLFAISSILAAVSTTTAIIRFDVKRKKQKNKKQLCYNKTKDKQYGRK